MNKSQLGPLLSPRDWQAIALREAAEYAGTAEGAARLAEAKRYGALADEIDRLRIELGRPLKAEADRDRYMKALKWLDRWLGEKSLRECMEVVKGALRA